MSFSILQDRPAIREKINKLFSPKTRHRRRVVLVNYLDDVAPKLFPDVYNVNIFCYPQPGNIDPYALEELSMKGAKIHFTNHINMNLFYVEREGVLLGSANYNFTKLMINNDYENIQDLMVFFKNNFLVDIDEIIKHLSKQVVCEKDLENFKEKHHIFWKTYEGLELFPKKMEDIKDQGDNNNENINVGKKIINYFRGIKKGFKSSNNDNHNCIIKKSDDILPQEINYTMDIQNENKTKKENMNVYCISKNDLLEIITDRLAKQKRKLH